MWAKSPEGHAESRGGSAAEQPWQLHGQRAPRAWHDEVAQNLGRGQLFWSETRAMHFKIRKRGIPAATEEWLLAAMALNLKRMVKTVFYKPKIRFNRAGDLFLFPSFLLLSTGIELCAN